MNSVRHTMTTTHASTVMMEMGLMTSCPLNRLMLGRLMTLGNTLGSDFQMSSAEFCRK